MGEYSRRLGSLRSQHPGRLADKAVDWLLERERPRKYAVTCDPAGVVMVERFAHAVPDDVVGVYDPQTIDGEGALVRIRLSRRIAEDLRHHRQVAHA